MRPPESTTRLEFGAVDTFVGGRYAIAIIALTFVILRWYFKRVGWL